jgi:hypothetical protein
MPPRQQRLFADFADFMMIHTLRLPCNS